MAHQEEELVELFQSAATEILGHRVEKLTLDAGLVELGLDSVAILEMVGHVERALDLTLPDDEIARARTVRDVVELIQRAQPGAERAP